MLPPFEVRPGRFRRGDDGAGDAAGIDPDFDVEHGALGREGLPIRLATSIIADRNGAHALADDERSERLVQWLAHSVDLMSSGRTFLPPGLFDRVRALGGGFHGYVYAIPSAMMTAPSLDGHDEAERRIRDNRNTLVTDEPMDTWALRVANETGLPYLPYFGYPSAGGAHSWALIPKLDVARPRDFPLRLAVAVDCEPRPLVLDPTPGRAAPVWSRAVIDVCRAHGADGLMSDDQNASYARPGEGQGRVNAIVKLYAARTPCDATWPRGRYAIVRNGNGKMYTDAAYQAEGDLGRLCRGADVAEEELVDCQNALTVQRCTLLAEVNALLEPPGAERRLTVWPNLHSLFSWRQDGSVWPSLAQQLGSEYAGFLASTLGTEEEVLARGGWWEKFCHDVQPETEFPLVKRESNDHSLAFSSTGVDLQRVVITGGGGASGPREELAIHRLRGVDQSLWLDSMRWISGAAQEPGRVRVEGGFTSIDDVQLLLASYLLARINAPRVLTTWAEFGAGAPIPVVEGTRFVGSTVSLFPRFIHPDANRAYLLCAPNVGAGQHCPFDASESGFHSSVEPKATHPIIAMDTLGGPFARADGGTANTWFRMLLDLTLGRPVGYGRRGGLYFARFEGGEAVAYPYPDSLTLPLDAFVRYAPVLPNGQTGMYMTIDADAIDALVGAGAPALAALAGRLPNWALSRHTDLPRSQDRVLQRDPLVLRRALEAGLQVAGDPTSGLVGTPGICLRRIDAHWPDVAMLPGMGRVIFYSGSEMGRRLLAQFPAGVAGTPRRVAQTATDFLRARMGEAVRRSSVGDGGLHWSGL